MIKASNSNSGSLQCMLFHLAYDSLNQHPDFVEKGNQKVCEFVDNEMPHGKKACNYQGNSLYYNLILVK